MKAKFNKDKWILHAISKGYILVEKDGTIWRAISAIGGKVDRKKGYRQVKFRTHPKSGRVYYNMVWMGFTKSVLVNRVVALRYLPNPDNLPQVNHIDGDKENNALSNLEWSTGSDNEKHAHRTGLKSGRGSGNSNAKLSVAQIHAIRASTALSKALAKKYGVTQSTINSIRSRRTWNHV